MYMHVPAFIGYYETLLQHFLENKGIARSPPDMNSIILLPYLGDSYTSCLPPWGLGEFTVKATLTMLSESAHTHTHTHTHTCTHTHTHWVLCGIMASMASIEGT